LAASSAFTVKVNGDPAVALAGAVTVKCVAVPADTVMLGDVPAIVEVTVSVVVTVWDPLVLSVTLKEPVPAVSVAFAGSTAAPSVEVKWTVPAYDVAVLLKASSAVTPAVSAVPEIAAEGALTLKWVATAAATTEDPEVPVMDALTVSVAVTLWVPAVLKVTPKVPVPDARVVLAGNSAALSVEVKCTVPA
jgi:hypothetical protein